MSLSLRSLFHSDAASGGGSTDSDPSRPSDGDPATPTDGGSTEGDPAAPDGGDAPAPTGDGPTEGDAPPADTAEDVTLQVRGGALVIGGRFELTDAKITPANLDAGTDAKRRAMRDRIGAGGRLQAGTGISISVADAAGERRIATDNPHARAGGDLDADNTFHQQRLDPVNEWRLEAVQQIAPRVVRLDYDSNGQKFSGTFPITHDGDVTGVLEYQRVAGSNQPNRGRFSLKTTPVLTRQTLGGKFDGGAIDALILQIAAEKTAAESAPEKEIPIRDDSDSSSMVAEDALTSDPGQMATATAVYVRVNLQFPVPGPYTVWRHDKHLGVPGTTVGTVVPSPGAMTVIDNGVILIGNTTSASKIRAFRNRDWASDSDVAASEAQGMAYDASTGKLYVLASGSSGVRVYELNAPNTPSSEVITPIVLAAANSDGSDSRRFGMAWSGTDLYVGFQDGNIRCFNKDGDHVRAKDITGGVTIYGMTAVGNYLAFGGEIQDGITFRKIGGGKEPDAIGPSALEAINPDFEVSAIAYDAARRRLYVLNHRTRSVAAFTAVNRAYPESKHGFHTMDRDRLKAEAREKHVRDLSLKGATLTVSKVEADGTVKAPADLKLPVAVEAVDRLPAPGAAGRRVWVKADYPVRSVYVQPHSFDGTALQNSDLGTRGYWRRATDGWAVGSLLGVFPALHMLSNAKLALLAGQVTGPTKLHVGANHYVLTAGSKNTRLLAGHDTLVDMYAITGGLPLEGDWNDVWIEGATESDRTPTAYDVKQGEYADTGSTWSPAGFDAPLGNAAHDFDLLIRERIPGAAQTVTEVLRTLDRKTLQDAIQGWFAPWAQAGSSAGIPLGRLPIEKLTQAEYDAKIAANTVDPNTVYVVVG